jgi:hypothetical protein
MKRYTIYILIFIVALIGAACELIVDVDVPLDDYRIVLNGVIRSDSAWRVDLFRERHILDRNSRQSGPPSQWTIVTTADVVVTDEIGNIVANLEQHQEGVYRATGNPEPGKTYHIKVEAPGYPTATAITTVPALVTIVRALWDSTNMVPGGDFSPPGYSLDVTIKDPPGVKNYYRIQLFVQMEQTLQQGPGQPVTDTVYTERYLTSNDPVYDLENGGFGLINDTFFDGQERTIRYIVPDQCCGRNLKTFLVLSTFNEEYYKYYTSLSLQRQVGFDPFAQPVVVFGNISGGLGIFGAASTSVREWSNQ